MNPTQDVDPQSAASKDAKPVSFHCAGTRSVLAWPAWLRLLTVAPALLLLWLAVLWALSDLVPR
ncbi:MAG: hypothetical protein IAE92_08015 [Burkholderiaceae bacterium]|nr:hypothetical protein [Burkholderiaceae bacterium]